MKKVLFSLFLFLSLGAAAQDNAKTEQLRQTTKAQLGSKLGFDNSKSNAMANLLVWAHTSVARIEADGTISSVEKTKQKEQITEGKKKELEGMGVTKAEIDKAEKLFSDLIKDNTANQ